jgi:hypothetical protein
MPVSINRYNQFPEYFGDNSIDLDGDTFKLELYNTSHTFTATHNDRADISANALSTANGYTSPGQNLASVTWVNSSGTITFDATDVTWTASAGPIVASDGVIYDDTSTSPAADLLCYSIDFDGEQTAGAGTDFVVTWNASGIFTVS